MASEAPPFWWERPDWRARALWPLSAIYGTVASRRMHNARREKVAAPVLCIGNPTVGGAGKTPTAIALARQARAMGLTPGFLSRGHGGKVGKPHLVDVEHDSAKSTGDEPLLLAREALTAVTRNRVAGARLLIGAGCDFLIMDDGFQSAQIHADLALLVIDGRRGLGNGHVIPGGPMRAPMVDHLRHADGLLVMGDGEGAIEAIRMTARAARPVYHARAYPLPGSGVEGKRLVAFAGIGDPGKFFDTVTASGGELVGQVSFADHHFYVDQDLQDLLARADEAEADLVTTAKDAVRIRASSPAARALLERLKVIEIGVRFEPENVPERLIRLTLDAFGKRS